MRKSALKVDFSHRLSCYSKDETFDPIDSIGLMTSRALGVLNLLAIQFNDDSERLPDALISGALDTAIQEIEDISALMRCWAKAENNNVHKKTD